MKALAKAKNPTVYLQLGQGTFLSVGLGFGQAKIDEIASSDHAEPVNRGLEVGSSINFFK